MPLTKQSKASFFGSRFPPNVVSRIFEQYFKTRLYDETLYSWGFWVCFWDFFQFAGALVNQSRLNEYLAELFRDLLALVFGGGLSLFRRKTS